MFAIVSFVSCKRVIALQAPKTSLAKQRKEKTGGVVSEPTKLWNITHIVAERPQC